MRPVGKRSVTAILREHQPDHALGEIEVNVGDLQKVAAQEPDALPGFVVAANYERHVVERNPVQFKIVGLGQIDMDPSSDPSDIEAGRSRISTQLECCCTCGTDHAEERTAIEAESNVGAVDLGAHHGPQAAHRYGETDHFAKYAFGGCGRGGGTGKPEHQG